MNNNISKDIEIADLAENINLSRYHFSRIFKHYTGIPPMKYFRKLRINKARELLRGNNMPIGLVGEKVGYPVTQHFSTVFKQETQLTPREYRNATVGAKKLYKP